MKNLLVLILSLLSISSYAQEKSKQKNVGDTIIGTPYNSQNKSENNIYNATGVNVNPQYSDGGKDGFYKFFNTNFRHPYIEDKSVKNLKIFVSFVIEKDGSLSNIKILRDPGYGVGKEVIRVIKLSPKWIPGQQDGKVVRTLYNLPLTVKL